MTFSQRRRRRSLLLAATACVALGGFAASSASAASLSDQTVSWAKESARTGAAPDTQRVTIAVHMLLKDQAGLRQMVSDVSKPTSKLYGHYLTKQQFAARFAPDAADVDAVRAMLVSAGMSEIVVGAAGTSVSATATVAQLRQAFGVSQDLYKVGDKTLRANREAPTVPAALVGKILFIEGLNDGNLKHTNHVTLAEGARRMPASLAAAPVVTPPPVASQAPSPYCSTYFGDTRATLSTKPNPYGQTLPWLNCGYTPQQIRAAYGLDKVTPDGAGVTVAITDAYAAPTLFTDANLFSARHGLPALTSATFSATFPAAVLTASPSEPCGPYGWWGEQSLDVDAVHGAAPGASILYVGSRDCGTSLTLVLNETIYNDKADVITNSWSQNGELGAASQAKLYDQAFMAAATMGITVLFSSGDSGDLSQINGVATASSPGNSVYATGVGGTTLFLRDASGTKQEWGWGTYRDYLGDALVNSATSVSTSGPQTTTVGGVNYQAYAYYSGAGGGISTHQLQPDYQVGKVPNALATTIHFANGTQSTLPEPHRVSPDVSMDADPYTGYLVGESYTVAGDSVNDTGCTSTGATTEYCELGFGGTSLASPLVAGMIAVANQSRIAAGRPAIGFFNPLLYSTGLGSTLTAKAINDVLPPATPTALLRGYVTDATRIRIVTVNSVPTLSVDATPAPLSVCTSYICEGINDVYLFTTPGFDSVTGQGVPFAPKLLAE